MSRLAEMMRDLASEAARVERDRDDALCEVDRLAKENGALCDEVAGLRAEVADLRRKWRAA